MGRGRGASVDAAAALWTESADGIQPETVQNGVLDV